MRGGRSFHRSQNGLGQGWIAKRRGVCYLSPSDHPWGNYHRVCCDRVCYDRLLCYDSLCYDRVCYDRVCCDRVCYDRLCYLTPSDHPSGRSLKTFYERVCYDMVLCYDRVCYDRVLCYDRVCYDSLSYDRLCVT